MHIIQKDRWQRAIYFFEQIKHFLDEYKIKLLFRINYETTVYV